MKDQTKNVTVLVSSKSGNTFNQFYNDLMNTMLKELQVKKYLIDNRKEYFNRFQIIENNYPRIFQKALIISSRLRRQNKIQNFSKSTQNTLDGYCNSFREYYNAVCKIETSLA